MRSCAPSERLEQYKVYTQIRDDLSVFLNSGTVRSTSATELDSVRVCAVSPGLVNESPQNVLDLFEGMSRIPAAELAQVYRRALEEGKSGMTYDAFGS